MKNKPVIIATTAHYETNKEGLKREGWKLLDDHLHPNKKYGTLLRLFYNNCTTPENKYGLLSLLQEHILLKTESGSMRLWSDLDKLYIPVPKCIPAGEEIILPHSFNYEGAMRASSCIFNIKLQLKIRKNGNKDYFVLRKSDMKHLVGHYSKCKGKSNSKSRESFLFSRNLYKNYFFNVSGNRYKFFSENKHLYKHLLAKDTPREIPQEPLIPLTKSPRLPFMKRVKVMLWGTV